jgi:hypothetical protein
MTESGEQRPRFTHTMNCQQRGLSAMEGDCSPGRGGNNMAITKRKQSVEHISATRLDQRIYKVTLKGRGS